MEPVKIIAERLCQRSLKLADVEPVFCFVIEELQQQNTRFADLMSSALKNRLIARSNEKLLSTVLYLKHGKGYTNKMNTTGIQLISKPLTVSCANKQYERLFKSDRQDSLDPSPIEPSQPEERNHDPQTLSDKLTKRIRESQGVDDAENKDKTKAKFTKELALFELNFERTTNVSKLHEAFKTIVPTSVEAERTFSAAGLFITKIRLSDKNINALSTMRTYFCRKAKA